MVLAADNAPTQDDLKFKVDVPVSLKTTNVGFDVGHVSFTRDMR